MTIKAKISILDNAGNVVVKYVYDATDTEVAITITIYSERIFARLFRHKNVFRILERFCH